MKISVQIPAVNTLRWFQCDGLYMAIERSSSVILHHLGLADGDNPEVADLIDMVLLEDFNGLLTCLDECSAREFDWRPLPVAADTEAANGNARKDPACLHELHGYPRLTASMSTMEGEDRRLLLSMDTATLNAMPPLPDEWQSLVRFTNYIRPMRLQLQSLTISTQEHCKLASGAMVLMPASFNTYWPCALLETSDAESSMQPANKVFMDADENRVRLLCPSDDQTTRTPDQTQTQTQTQTKAQLISIELEELLQINELYTQSVWQSRQNMVITLSQPLLGSKVIVRVGEKIDDATLENPNVSTVKAAWSGALMKIGTGYGVLLEQPA